MEDIELNDVMDNIIWITKQTFEVLKKWWSDCISVYMFYYYTARWQKTNQVKATVWFVSKWLSISENRTREARKYLLWVWLIEDIQTSTREWKKWFWEKYIKVNYILKQANWAPSHFTDYAQADYDKLDTNALSNNNKMLEEEKQMLEQPNKEECYCSIKEDNKDISVCKDSNKEESNISSCNVRERKEKKEKKADQIENRDEIFKKLWEWYCLQNTKKQTEMKQARVYFDKLIKTNYDLDLLRYALPRYISSITNKQYLVLLRTYLSKESYLDYKSEFDNLNKTKEVKVEDKEEPKENSVELKFKRTYEN